jgi:hypothetical protein
MNKEHIIELNLSRDEFQQQKQACAFQTQPSNLFLVAKARQHLVEAVVTERQEPLDVGPRQPVERVESRR